MTSEFRVGLLGHGTVGGAFARLLEERADGIAAATGRPAVLAGVLTRREGDFEAILEGSDAIVELMAGSTRRATSWCARCGRAVTS